MAYFKCSKNTQKPSVKIVADWDFNREYPRIDSVNGYELITNNNTWSTLVIDGRTYLNMKSTGTIYVKIPSDLYFNFNANYTSLSYAIDFYRYNGGVHVIDASKNFQGNSAGIGVQVLDRKYYFYNPESSSYRKISDSFREFDESILTYKIEKVSNNTAQIKILKDDDLIFTSNEFTKEQLDLYKDVISIGSRIDSAQLYLAGLKVITE